MRRLNHASTPFQVLSEEAGQGDAVSSRREHLEKGQALNGEQAKRLKILMLQIHHVEM